MRCACPLLREITEIIKKFKSLYGLGRHCPNIRLFGFETMFSVYVKRIKLDQMTTLNLIFRVVVSIVKL
mgnify:CR=1 FL=1